MSCSYCWGRGHNKMGCPKAKEEYEAVLPEWKKWQTMDHKLDYYKDSLWRAGTHFGWTYRHREAMEIYIRIYLNTHTQALPGSSKS